MRIQRFARLGFVSLFAACSWGQTSPPVIAAGGILNAADYGTALAPGTMVSIFGTNLAPRTAAASSVPLPTALEGVSVEAVSAFSSSQLPLYFVSSGQINAQLPYSMVGTTLEIRVRNVAGVSATRQITLTPRAPRLFTKTQDGKGEAILLHATNYRLVTDLEPATPGEYLILYLTGLGEVSPAVQPGRAGGDGASLGPLNRVTATVTATLGGVSAPVLFAGLAPGFVGVYQLNIQAPANLPAGRPVVSVAVANVTSQANIWISAGAPAANNPEDVLRRALEAQARGDITALLGECSSLDGKPAASSTRKAFEAVQRMAQFSNFRFTHLATAQGDKGTLAVVRARVNYSVAVRGVVEPLAFGLLGVMKKDSAGWKVAALVPDDLVNLEEFAAASGAFAAKGMPTASALDLKTLNQAITDAMKGGYVDQEKLEVAIAMGTVGQFGPAGDLAANAYQVYDTLKNIKDAASEAWTNGMSPIGYVKAEQVAVGIFQIVSEPIPGMDAFADSVQASLEQFGFNLEIMRGLAQLKYQLYKAPVDGLRFSPQLALLEPFQFNYPAGMEITGDPEIVHAAGTPVRSILFKSPHSVGHRLPLRVLGEIPVEKGFPIYSIAERLGGKLRGTTYYIPVDVTHLVSGELASGDILLDNYARYRGEKSGARVLLWDANCRRGRELLRVSLRNGETTPVVNIVNWFMNVIDDFRLTGLDTGNQFKLKAGEERAFTVTGASSLLDASLWPNLTPWSACFDMQVRDATVASAERTSPTARLRGLKKGTTVLVMLLPGAAGDPGVVELTRSVPVIVEEEVVFPRFKGIYFQISTWPQVRDQISGRVGSNQPVDISNDLGRDDFISAFTTRSGVLFKQLTFTGNTFRTDPTRFSRELTSGTQAGIRISGEIDISGTLDPANRRLVSLKGRVLVINECCKSDGYTGRKTETVKELELGPLTFNGSFSESGAIARGPEVTAAARRISFTRKQWSSGRLVEDWVTTSIAPSTDNIPRLDVSFTNNPQATEVP